MKKRFLALLCAATMVLGASMSVCAEGSITADEAKQEAQEAIKDVNATAPAEVKVEQQGEKVVAKIDDSTIEGTVVAPVTDTALKASAVEAKKVVNNANVEVKELPLTKENVTKVVNMTTKAAEQISQVAQAGADVKIKSEMVVVDVTPKAGQDTVVVTLDLELADNERVFVTHAGKNGIETFELKKGELSFTLTDFSPVGYVIYEVSEEADDDDSDNNDSAPATTTTKAPTSPKTGDVFAAMALLAAVSGTASAALAKKAKKN